MRLHRLEIEGFGPFRARQVVDFDDFADDGIFLIAGRTGAGKSSILDAVCFGLYGGVPRYESGDKRLRSDHCDPEDTTVVVVEFSTSAGRFRVTRSPEYLRPAKRGGGVTKQASTAALDELTDAGWVGRAARAVDVAGELEGILQLNMQQFLQVILLAQNRFARFLLADSKERQQLLRRLFGTERFEDVQARFDERRRASEHLLGARLATVTARIEEAEQLVTTGDLWGESSPDAASDAAQRHAASDDAERLESLRRALARAEYRAERRAAERDDAERSLAAADAALTEAREQRQAQDERDRARRALAALDAEEERIAESRERLDRARAAEGLRSILGAHQRADAALTEAVRIEEAARDAWLETGVALHEDSVEELQKWASEQTRASGGWERGADLEAATPVRAEELTAAEAAVAAARARAEAVEEERAALPPRLAAVTEGRDEVRRVADRAEEAQRLRDSAVERRDAAREVAQLSEQVDAAERELAGATDSQAAAQSALARLRQRRLDGMAGELATELAPGVPCTVCGATEHPAPADHIDPVSADDIAEAERERDAAAQAERTASDRVAALRLDLAGALARTGGLTLERAEEQVAAAEGECATAAAAAERVGVLDAEIAELQVRLEMLEGERGDVVQALAGTKEQLAVLQRSEREAERQIAEARGEFETVADRIAATSAQIGAATAFAVAQAQTRERSTVFVQASGELASALRASAFADADAATDALLSRADQDALEARLTAHAVQREKERAILLGLELRALPEEPIELTAVSEAAAQARAAWIASVDEASRAAATADRLRSLITSAAAEHARSAEEAAEHQILRGLADTLAGRGANTHKMTLETFVLAAELEEIVDAANRRLSAMSGGRYQLRHSDALAARGAASGLGIVVFDAFTGQTRPAQSLSGGETFLGSLALALGLAEVVTARAGGIQLDTLFIDEGFGSLDADTLDIAMRTLDELRQGGRTVGVISHVEAMQEQIPAQLTVRAAPDGPSVIDAR